MDHYVKKKKNGGRKIVHVVFLAIDFYGHNTVVWSRTTI